MAFREGGSGYLPRFRCWGRWGRTQASVEAVLVAAAAVSAVAVAPAPAAKNTTAVAGFRYRRRQ